MKKDKDFGYCVLRFDSRLYSRNMRYLDIEKQIAFNLFLSHE